VTSYGQILASIESCAVVPTVPTVAFDRLQIASQRPPFYVARKGAPYFTIRIGSRDLIMAEQGGGQDICRQPKLRTNSVAWKFSHS